MTAGATIEEEDASHEQQPATEEDLLERSLLERDQLLSNQLGILHGLPIGVGHAPIRTSNLTLQRIIVDATQAMLDMGEDLGCSPEESVILELKGQAGKRKDLDDGEGEYRFHRAFALSRQWRGMHGYVFIYQHRTTGKYHAGFDADNPVADRMRMLFRSIESRENYTLSGSEERAQLRLRSILRAEQWHTYQLSGTVMEYSDRSKVMYILRRDRPTIATRFIVHPDGKRVSFRALCALCLHPLAHYDGTWTGVMPPSDEIYDVICMIRSDEHFLWRSANQHPLHHMLSGL